MSGDLVNLRRFRKDKARAEKDATAAANRAKFGRTKEQKAADAAEADKARRLLDGAKREPGEA
jgi:hypothetical protein